MMHLLKQVSKHGLSRISLVASVIITLGLAAGLAQAYEVADGIMPKLGLKSGELITIDQEQAGKSEMAIKMNGQPYTIDYAYFSNRSKNFRLMVQQENGEIVEQAAPAVSTIRGTLRDVEGSRVVGCITEDGCCAKIQMPSGENCYIEPVNKVIDNPAFAGVHVVYTERDVIPTEGQCGNETNLVEAEQNFAEKFPLARNRGGLLEAEIFVDADYEYFSIFGSTGATLDRIELIVNVVNDQYESEVGLRHTIAGAMIWETSSDPYTTSDASALLGQFRSYYQGQGNVLLGGVWTWLIFLLEEILMEQHLASRRRAAVAVSLSFIVFHNV